MFDRYLRPSVSAHRQDSATSSSLPALLTSRTVASENSALQAASKKQARGHPIGSIPRSPHFWRQRRLLIVKKSTTLQRAHARIDEQEGVAFM